MIPDFICPDVGSQPASVMGLSPSKDAHTLCDSDPSYPMFELHVSFQSWDQFQIHRPAFAMRCTGGGPISCSHRQELTQLKQSHESIPCGLTALSGKQSVWMCRGDTMHHVNWNYGGQPGRPLATVYVPLWWTLLRSWMKLTKKTAENSLWSSTLRSWTLASHRRRFTRKGGVGMKLHF